MLIIDLSEYDVTYDTVIDSYTISSHIISTPIINLAKEKWVFVLVAEDPKANNDELVDYNFYYNITTRINFHDDKDMWMVPLTSLVGPCFVLYDKNYYDSDIADNIDIDHMIAYSVNLMINWGDAFLP